MADAHAKHHDYHLVDPSPWPFIGSIGALVMAIGGVAFMQYLKAGDFPFFGVNLAIAVSATKSATGHLLGAAGGLGAIFTILALKDQVAPPTLNLKAPDPAGDGIDFIANEARPIEMQHAICNGFGFGGVNASALFRRWTESQPNGNGAGAVA